MSESLDAFFVEALFIHPIKSCAPVSVPRLDFTHEGRVVGDRQWAVVEDGGMSWMGAHPRLALVRPEFSGDRLVINSGLASVPLEAPREEIQIRIWNDVSKENEVHGAFDAGDEAAAALREITGADLRLVKLGPSAITLTAPRALHVFTRASVEEVQRRWGHAVDPLRFRPNVLLGSETPLAFIEEQVARLTWAEGRLLISEPCVRCIMPNVDPRDASVDEALGHTVAAMSAERKPGGPSLFGVYAQIEAGTSLSVGTRLDVELAF